MVLAGKQDGEDAGIVVTADTIVLALQHLPIPALRQAFKDGWKPTFHTLPVRDGRGYSAVFSLPLGVTAEMIADQRAVLARNLHRAEIEVWPSDAEKAGTGPAGTVAVWIADPGVLSKPAPEYPLLHEGTADVFKGVPGGVSPRGDELPMPVVGNNFVVRRPDGPGQVATPAGSSCSAARWIRSPSSTCSCSRTTATSTPTQPRLARYVKGVEDDTIAAAVARLHELYARGRPRREARLAELGAKKVTRQLAQAAPRTCGRSWRCSPSATSCSATPSTARWPRSWPPRRSSGPARPAITLLFDTQSSRKEAIPPKLVELVSVNACFYVKTWRSNDGFLGDGSFAAGIRATELRPGRDRGTSLITGVSDAQFELLRWYFVEVDDDTGFDAAADVIARAVGQGRAGHAGRRRPARRPRSRRATCSRTSPR